MKFIKDFEEISKTNANTLNTGDDSAFGEAYQYDETDPLIVPQSSGKIIDVVNMDWYAGKRADPRRLSKIPRGIITERKQQLNSILSGAIYYLGAVLNAAKKDGRQAAENMISPSAVSGFLEGITKIIPTNAIKGFTALSSDIQEQLQSDKSLLKKNNLSSLLGIYLTKETGFKYVFPYLNGPTKVSGSWADEGEGLLSGVVNKGMELIDEISSVANITQPGVYIQKPKYFNFDSTGKSITFNFPLFNTVKKGTFDYKSNYELLWLLAFQNKPFKTSFARTTPGKIYTVEVPGIVSMPYSYISDMSVDFRGTVRHLPVDCPTIYNAPIPEAYVVNITFQSLLTDFANTMATGSGFTTTLKEYSADIQF